MNLFAGRSYLDRFVLGVGSLRNFHQTVLTRKSEEWNTVVVCLSTETLEKITKTMFDASSVMDTEEPVTDQDIMSAWLLNNYDARYLVYLRNMRTKFGKIPTTTLG